MAAAMRAELARRRQGPRAQHFKEVDTGESSARVPGTFVYAHCSTRGLRATMEDAVSCKVDFAPGLPASGFFGVFDGHGGAEVAKYVAQALPAKLATKIRPRVAAPAALPPVTQRGRRSAGGRNSSGARRRMQGFKASPSSQRRSAARAPPTMPSQDTVTVSEWPPRLETPLNARVRSALRETFVEVDAQCRDAVGAETVGTTACCVLLLRDHYAFCNAGDSRAILVSGGRVVFHTADHKPEDRRERSRIYAAGGFVVRGRVRGVLAVARALGDFAFKAADGLGPADQEVTCDPDIVLVDRQHHRDEFLVVACDGVWDVMSNEAVASFVADALAHTRSAEQAATMLVDAALQRGSTDNLSAIVVQFVDGSLRAPLGRAPPRPAALPPIAPRHRRTMANGGGGQHRAGASSSASAANVLRSSASASRSDVEAADAAAEALRALDVALGVELEDESGC